MAKYVPVKELAQTLSCHAETVRRMLRAGEVPGVKVGRDWRVDPQAVEKALQQPKKS